MISYTFAIGHQSKLNTTTIQMIRYLLHEFDSQVFNFIPFINIGVRA